jgi:hypothetical protein
MFAQMHKMNISVSHYETAVDILSVSPFIYTVCPQSPFGVLKNCGAQTN